MAIGDFMHKQLVSAAGRDALTSMGAGAGIGAALGAGSALVTGNDSMMGGAMSGAMLGAGGGAAMRYAGTKYGANYAAKVAADPSANKGTLDLTMFSKKQDVDPFDFMSNSDSNNAALKALQDTAVTPKAATAGAGVADATGNAPTGAVKTGSGAAGTTPERVKNMNDAKAAFGTGNTPENRHGDAQAAWEAKKAAFDKSAPARANAKAMRMDPVDYETTSGASAEAAAFQNAIAGYSAGLDRVKKNTTPMNLGAPNQQAQERDAFRRAAQEANSAATANARPMQSTRGDMPNFEARMRDVERNNAAAYAQSTSQAMNAVANTKPVNLSAANNLGAPSQAQMERDAFRRATQEAMAPIANVKRTSPTIMQNMKENAESNRRIEAEARAAMGF